MTRKEHVEQLASQLGVGIIYDETRYRMAADPIFKVVHLAPWGSVPDEEVYAVALHELGHLADEERKYQWEMEDWERAEEEARAWLWAARNSEFPLDRAWQSAMAWGVTERMHFYGWRPSETMRQFYELLAPEPDWYQDVTTPAHYAKLDGWAKPTWARLAEEYGAVLA